MRHAVLSEQWYPAIGGSIGLFDALYGQHFPPSESVHFVVGGGDRHGALDRRYPRPVTRFDDTRYPWMKPESAAAYARMVAAAAATVRREGVSVLHCGRVIPEGLVGLALHRALGLPFTVWVHGEEVAIYRQYAVKKRLMPEVFRAARAVFVNSSFSEAMATLAGAPAEKVHVINPGVDAAAFSARRDVSDLVAKHGLAGKRVLLTVGRLTRRKGHDVVLSALARLRAAGRLEDVAWVVLSDGELEAELKAQCTRLGLDDVVRWVGPVSAAEVPRYYCLGDVFVHPNRTLADNDVEGFGMVFLEASAAAMPVIGGRSGGVVDAVRDGYSGLLVDGAEVDQVSQAIDTLLHDEALRKTLGENGPRWAEGFSWPRQAARVAALSLGRPEP
ncbi:MAG: glycosyltransferase family 4 protein [Myxococcales bacterium]|nr:glycosyltransferase family 4 protein [Myxococcales bacterium]